MTTPGRPLPFRAGRTDAAKQAQPHFSALTGPSVLLADVSEFDPNIADPVYLQFSQAIVIRAAYGAHHDDLAWRGGLRRARLHSGGARFVGIYQYLVADQDPAAQAQALNDLVGELRPGEVLIPDFEEGQHAMLTGWYNAQLADRGSAVAPYLWTYSGLNFGEANGALPVEWIAAYQATEPASAHKLWQFTDDFAVPGVGTADCSIFHGTMDELAALAYQEPQAAPPFGPPRNLAVHPGDGSVRVDRCDPPAGVAPDHYEVSVFTGSYPSPSTLVATYPRYMKAAPKLFGSLGAIPSGEHMTCRVVAVDAAGRQGAYADARFTMP